MQATDARIEHVPSFDMSLRNGSCPNVLRREVRLTGVIYVFFETCTRRQTPNTFPWYVFARYLGLSRYRRSIPFMLMSLH